MTDREYTITQNHILAREAEHLLRQMIPGYSVKTEDIVKAVEAVQVLTHSSMSRVEEVMK